MRVLHVIPSVAPRYGGPSEAVVRLAAAQRAAGMETLIATTDADGPGRALGVPHGEVTDWRGVPCVFFPRWPGEGVKYSPRLGKWLDRNAAGFDLLHLHAFFSHSVVAGARAARAAGRPYFVRPLGTLGGYGLRRRPLRKRAFLAAWGRGVLAGAAGVHCTSGAERVEVEAIGARRAFVVPLGVCSPASGASREPVVVFIGRLDPKKNVESLIDAFSTLREPGWRLVIAGSGDAAYEHGLRARASGGPVEFTGWVDEEQRDALLSRASLFVLPSRYENFGIAVAEAMAAGVPVIVSEEVDLAAEVAAKGAGWTYAGERALPALLAEAVRDGEGRRARGLAAGDLARERFGWPRCVEALSLEYGRCLPRRVA